MRIKSGFMLRNIADIWILVPLGERVVDFNGLITLSETGAHLWEKCQDGIDKEMLVKELLAEYDVDCVTASSDVDEFLKLLDATGLLEQ